MFAQLIGLKTLSPDALARLLKQGGDVAVIDVNSPQSWAKARVPGARNLDPVTFADTDLPPDSNALLVFYCSNPLCRKAPNAARRAKLLGYVNVRVMSAGISGWISGQHPTESGA